jgi:hypothetical protein
LQNVRLDLWKLFELWAYPEKFHTLLSLVQSFIFSDLRRCHLTQYRTKAPEAPRDYNLFTVVLKQTSEIRRSRRYNTCEPKRYYLKWNKADAEGQILHGLTYI